MIYDIRLPKDAHGQPMRPFKTNDLQNAAKAIERLSSIALGILADGVVSDQEACFFREWLQKNKPAYPNRWFDDVIRRVEGIFADGIIDDEEREELAEILRSLNGSQSEPLSTPVAFDNPPPRIQFRGRIFCPTGKFCFGARKRVAEAIIRRGGEVVPKFCNEVNYLLVGTFSSRDWVESSWGRKIEAAVERRAKTGVAIVSEEHWRDHMQLIPTFTDGFADDFRMAVPDAFAGAFDAQAFRPGDVFYSTRKAYQGTWGQALPEIDFSFTVESCTNEGVGFKVSEKENGKLVGKRALKLPYFDFVECLRSAQVPDVGMH